MVKLTKEEIKAKKKYHKKRVDFYNKKLEEIESNSNRIGFKHYD